MVQKIVTFDVALKSTERQWVQKIPEVYTNDLGSVSIQFKITDCTDTELTGSTAIVLLKMRDGSFFQGPSVDVTRTLNVFSYTLKENEGNHDGLAEIQLIVTVDTKKFATQKYNFKVITGLDSEVAREIMIYDWSTLTAEARAYIDQFTADEVLRDAEFDNNQFDRNVAFNAAQGQRTTDFGLAQTQRNTDFGSAQAQRVNAFNAAEAARVQAFNSAETARAAGYDADHSRAGTDHTGAVADRDNAATDRTNAATDRTNAAADRTLAGTDHTRAEEDHTRADSDSATVAGFNGRLAAEETATAANKISAVKGKTFADVDARFEDVEADTTMMGMNLVTNGGFNNGKTGWSDLGLTSASRSVVNSELVFTVITPALVNGMYQMVNIPDGNIVYFAAKVFPSVSSQPVKIGFDGQNIINNKTIANQWNLVSGTGKRTTGDIQKAIILSHETTNYTVNQTFKFAYAIAIDLTATFGKGNEPTVEQMDAIMAKFPNSWFDGTKNLFQAKASLNKLMVLDARTEFEAKNILANGDFSNGTTGWSGNGGTPSASNNELTITITVLGSGVGTYYKNAMPTTIGAKYYILGKIYPKYSNGIQVGIDGGDTFSKSTLVPLTWNNVSGICSASETSSTFVFYRTVNTQYALGDTFKFKEMTIIDLTATFGAGKEPTQAEMDRLMARFPNSWFDGVKPIQTIETLYQEKANKAQEAWITPTLLNGWVQHTSFENVAYMKDDMGFVHLRGGVSSGAIATLLLTLPSGYRQVGNKLTYHRIASSNGLTEVEINHATGDLKLTKDAGTWYDLNAITFKV